MEVDDDRQLTRVTWLEVSAASRPWSNLPRIKVHVYVFRQRASLFGHNAPDPRLLAQNDQLSKLANIAHGTWKNFDLSGTTIDLDQAYPKVVPGGWVALVSDDIRHAPSSLPGYAELYHVDAVTYPSVAAFGLSSKVTRITLDSAEHLDW